eukprot:ctg_2357.g591
MRCNASSLGGVARRIHTSRLTRFGLAAACAGGQLSLPGGLLHLGRRRDDNRRGAAAADLLVGCRHLRPHLCVHARGHAAARQRPDEDVAEWGVARTTSYLASGGRSLADRLSDAAADAPPPLAPAAGVSGGATGTRTCSRPVGATGWPPASARVGVAGGGPRAGRRGAPAVAGLCARTGTLRDRPVPARERHPLRAAHCDRLCSWRCGAAARRRCGRGAVDVPGSDATG